MYKVLIPLPIHPSGTRYLRERGYEVVENTPTDEESMKRLIADADAAIIKGTPITEAILKAGKPRLKLIARHGIGCDNVDIKAATKQGVWAEFLPTGLKFSDDTHLLFSSNKVKRSKEARISKCLQHRSP